MPSKIGLDGYARGAKAEEQLSLTVASLFKSESGKQVLKYLRSITVEMVNGPNVDTNALLHQEGQRYIVGLIERRIEHAHRINQNESKSS